MKNARTTLTGQELEIMKVVWRLGPVTVRQVYEALLEQRKIASAIAVKIARDRTPMCSWRTSEVDAWHVCIWSK